MRFLAVFLISCFVIAGTASAEPGSGPREDINQTFTATTPNTSTGLDWSATYHATGDPNARPPYLERMVFYSPPGFRFDTSAPVKCTATDLELSLNGPAACPPKSVIGTGTTEGIFQFPVAHQYDFDHFKHDTYVINNANEQILLVHSEGYTVVRGQVGPDSSIDFHTPTCFPYPPTGCADEYIVQLATTSHIPALTRAGRSYATTPPSCPDTGYWETTVKYWWSDGQVDAVPTRQPCSATA